MDWCGEDLRRPRSQDSVHVHLLEIVRYRAQRNQGNCSIANGASLVRTGTQKT